MSTPLCPRCGGTTFATAAGSRLWCTADRNPTCLYGNHDQRSLIPQPDPVSVGVAFPVGSRVRIKFEGPDFARLGTVTNADAEYDRFNVRLDGEDRAGLWHAGSLEIAESQPAPTPQRTDAVGVAPLESAIAEVLGGPSEHGAQWSARLIHTMLVRDGWVKQPAPTPAANAYPCPHGRANFNACPHCMGLNQYGPPSETVTTTATVTDATSAGVDEGMVRELRDLIAKTEWEAGRPGSVYPGCEFQEELAEAAARAILATHEIVRRPQ